MISKDLCCDTCTKFRLTRPRDDREAAHPLSLQPQEQADGGPAYFQIQGNLEQFQVI